MKHWQRQYFIRETEREETENRNKSVLVMSRRIPDFSILRVLLSCSGLEADIESEFSTYSNAREYTINRELYKNLMWLV